MLKIGNKINSKQKNNFRNYKAETALFARRLLVVFIFILCLIVILITNIYTLQIMRYNDYSTRSNENRIKVIPIEPERGSIFDRNGIPLAINQTIYNIEVIVDKLDNLNQFFSDITPIIDLTEEDIKTFKKERKMTRPYNPVTLKTQLNEAQIARFAINQHRFPYAEIKGHQHRHYPNNNTLTHALGYVSKINENDLKRLTNENRLQYYSASKNIGKLGIERYYEALLHGKPGFAEVEVDSRGRIIRQLNETPPTAGQDIYLTIDLPLQQYVEQLLNDKRASVVITDPNNGEVLAFVSSPNYDPNLFVDGISSANYNKLLEDPNKPLYNRATQGVYPPASTVKPFIAVAALATNTINPRTVIHDVGWWQLPKSEKRFRDWRRGGHGRVDLNRSIAASVDTFYYQVAYNLGIDRLSEWMKKFGFGHPSGIDISKTEEQQGNMPTREWKMSRYKKSWLPGDTIPIGIGQGYWTATPIQLVNALMTLINNGQSQTPHLLLKFTDLQQEHYYHPHNISQSLQGIPLEYWEIAKEGMINVINAPYGTAYRYFQGTNYKAAGKSGTAQVYGLKKDEVYNAKKIAEHLRDHALFIAYAPYDNPQIALSVVLENGGSGSRNGGALTRKILDYFFTEDKSVFSTVTEFELKSNLERTD